VSESPYVFIFCSLLSLFICFFFLRSRLFGDTCIHGSTDLFRPPFDLSLLLFSAPSLFFMSCSHLISLLCFNLLWDTIFRTATPCTHQIWCGRHDRVCDVVHFDHHQHFGPLLLKSRTHCAGVSESRGEATYRLDDNTLKKRKRWARSIDFRRHKIANRNSYHSLSQSTVS
jgi:hypothetical protein